MIGKHENSEVRTFFNALPMLPQVANHLRKRLQPRNCERRRLRNQGNSKISSPFRSRDLNDYRTAYYTGEMTILHRGKKNLRKSDAGKINLKD